MGTQVPTAHPCTRRDLRGSSAALRQALGNSNRTAIPAQHYTSSNEPLLVGHTQDSSTTAETARRNVPSTRTRLPTRAGWTGPSQLNSTPAPPPPIATEPRGSAPLRSARSNARAAQFPPPRCPSPNGRRPAAPPAFPSWPPFPPRPSYKTGDALRAGPTPASNPRGAKSGRPAQPRPRGGRITGGEIPFAPRRRLARIPLPAQL